MGHGGLPTILQILKATSEQVDVGQATSGQVRRFRGGAGCRSHVGFDSGLQ